MAKINQVAKGQPDWQEPVNNLIDSWNALGGGDGEPLEVQSVTGTSAVTPMNGAKFTNGSIWYVSVNGGKIVTVNIVLTVPEKVVQDTVYGKIPSDLAPNDNTVTASTYYSNTGTEIGSDAALYTTGSTGGTGGFTRWNATYIRKD